MSKGIPMKQWPIGEITSVYNNANVDLLGSLPQKNTARPLVKCRNCGYEWTPEFRVLQRGSGCPKCFYEGIKVQPQGYHDLAQKKGFEWLGPYSGDVLELTNWRCPEGHEWPARYANIYSDKRCPYCAGVAQKTRQDYHKKARSLGFEWLGPYTGWVKDETNWRCSEDHEWPCSYDGLKGCPYCWRTLKQDYHEKAHSLGFEWLGPYPGDVTVKTLWRCPKGHEWDISYKNLKRCPECNGYKGPTRIKVILRAMGIDFETEKRFSTCRYKSELPFDFFVPAAKLLIEYQGEHHFKSVWGPLSDVKRNDKIKADWVQESSYELLYINYWDYERIAEILGGYYG